MKASQEANPGAALLRPGKAIGETSNPMLRLDGSYGEGGGQVLRTALSLAVALRRPVALTRVRVRRPKPGLQPQHLTVVKALAAISDAAVSGDALGSTELTFIPRTLRAGRYRFDVAAVKGSAGSVSLLFQALLPPLALAPGPSQLTLLGGTHVPWSPPFHYITAVFLPALAVAGVRAQLNLCRWGWYPAGGGEVEGTITPTGEIRGFIPAPPPRSISGVSAVSRLPRSIAERQRRRVIDRLAEAGVTADISLEEDSTARGPGTLVFLSVPHHAGFSALGRRGLPAEQVADIAVNAFLAYRASGACIDEHLADQLVPLLALARTESAFTCPVLSPHLQTVAWVVQQFLPVNITLEHGSPPRVRIIPPPTQPGSGGRGQPGLG